MKVGFSFSGPQVLLKKNNLFLNTSRLKSQRCHFHTFGFCDATESSLLCQSHNLLVLAYQKVKEMKRKVRKEGEKALFYEVPFSYYLLHFFLKV